jgi:hypothetical protein
MMTPLMGGVAGGGPPGSSTPSQTPLRDQLSINPDDSLTSFESVKSARQQQLEVRAQLRAGLGSLPAPKNDFEIVVPEDEEGGMEVEEGSEVDSAYIEDAAEVDERRAKVLKEAGEMAHSTLILCVGYYAWQLLVWNAMNLVLSDAYLQLPEYLLEWKSISDTIYRHRDFLHTFRHVS